MLCRIFIASVSYNLYTLRDCAMIRTTRLLPLLCLSLASSLMLCSDDEDGEFACQQEHSQVKSDREQSISRSHHGNSEAENSEPENEAPSSPVRVALSPSLPASATPLARPTAISSLTTTSQATSSSSSFATKTLNKPITDESKLTSPSPFQQFSPQRSSRTHHRRTSVSSGSNTSRSTVTQTTQDDRSPEMQRRNLDQHVVGEATLMMTQGAAPVARAETGFLEKLWSTAQPYVQCQRTITETAIKDNTFCEKYPTEPSRFSSISGALTELTLQAEQKLDQDYLVRAKKVLNFAHQNNIPVLEKQSQALLVTLQNKQREYAELNALLIAHTAQTTTKTRPKKPAHISKSKKASESD